MSDVEANSVQRVCLSTSRPWWRLHLSSIALTLLAADVLATLIVPADYWAGSGIRHRFEYGWPWHYATAISNEDEPSLQGYFGPMTDRAPWMLPRLWWVGKNATWHPRALAADLGLGLAIVAVVAAVLEWRRRRRRSVWQFTTKDLIAATLVAALVVGWFARAKQQRDAEQLALEQLAPWQRTLPGSTPSADRFMFYAGPDWLHRFLSADRCTWFNRCRGLDVGPAADNPTRPLPVAAFTNFRSLQCLTVNTDLMREADLLNVVRQTRVASLILRDVQLSEHACLALGTIPTLKDLRIEGARIGDGAVEQLVRGGLEQVLVIFAATDADPIHLTERLGRQFPSRQFSSGKSYLQFARTKIPTP